MTMTIKYEGVRTDPIKMPSRAKPEKEDVFIKSIVTFYMQSFPKNVINWSAKIKVTVNDDVKIKYLVSEILDLHDGEPLTTDL